MMDLYKKLYILKSIMFMSWRESRLEAMDYINILRDMANEMYDEVWRNFDRYWGRVSSQELGRILDDAAAGAAYRFLLREGLDFGVVSEEWPVRKRVSYPLLIIDPVDGTNNFSRGIRFSSISLAVALGNDLSSIVAGLVMDLFNKDVYWAVPGGGAYLNGSRIRVGNPKNFSELFVSIVINKSILRPRLIELLGRVKILRFFGSSALELSLIASGKLDAFIDLRGKLRVFDFAPGYLLVKEAGGAVYVSQNEGDSLSISRVGGFSLVASSTEWFLKKVLASL